jgi:hypothetical protein
MRPRKILAIFIPSTLLALACTASGLSQPTQTAMPPEEPWIVTPLPTKTSLPTMLPEYPQATPVPAWVTEFADPILAAAADRKPDFQDDFSQYRGWFNVISDIYGYFPAERTDGKLFLRLPEKTEDSLLFNQKLNRSNFVLMLDLRFVHDQPWDTVRFQFERSPDDIVTFDLTNNRNWKFQWGTQANPRSTSGIYEHFPPEFIPVTIIMQGAQCAVFLNDDPLTYADNCITSPASPHKWKVTFHLLRDTPQAVVVNFDNVKLWDLDKIPDMP